MAALMRDPTLRVQILRFIDVYPILCDPRRVRDHLAAYLAQAARPAPRRPPLAARAVRWGGRIATGRSTPARVSAALSRWAVRHMAHRFIVEQDAVESLRALEREGLLFTLDVLGESVHSDAEADAFAAKYEQLAGGLETNLGPREETPLPPAARRCGPRVNLSIKLSALCAHFDPAAPEHTSRHVRARLRPILRAAQRTGAFINVDVERFEVRDLTWHIVRDVLSEEEFAGSENIGLVVQSYLRDAPGHLAEILAWLRRRGRRMTLRLVKGAYWDSEQIWARQRAWPIPVLLSKPATDAQCERMLQTLLEHRALVRTALGSHNLRTISRALALAEMLGAAPGDFECQVLHGMGDTLRRGLVAMGVPVRVYVPWGPLIPGMSYLVRRLLENTSNESFLRQMSGHAGRPEELLRDPATRLPPEAIDEAVCQ